MFTDIWSNSAGRGITNASGRKALLDDTDNEPDALMASCGRLHTQLSNTDSAMQYSFHEKSHTTEAVWWTSRLPTTGERPLPADFALNTPTSASAEYWSQHHGNPAIFNVGLVTDGHQDEPVTCAAVDLAAYSNWFQSLLDNLGTLSGTDLASVIIPCGITRPHLQQLVESLYKGTLQLDADNVEALYRAADAMQMHQLVEVCESYLFAAATGTPTTTSSSSASAATTSNASNSSSSSNTPSGASNTRNLKILSITPAAAATAATAASGSSNSNQEASGSNQNTSVIDVDWARGVFDLAVDLHRRSFADKLTTHFATLAQRAPAQHKQLLCHMLSSELYQDDGKQQLRLLRAGWEAAWSGQGSEVLLLNVLMEVAEVMAPHQITKVLAEGVAWDRLQVSETLALVDWVLGLPPGLPITGPLKDAALRCISTQGCQLHAAPSAANSTTTSGSSAAARHYLVWPVDLGALPSAAGQRLFSGSALSVGRGRLYLSVERVSGSDWGLFLCPPPDVSLTSRVTHHTLFVLGHSFTQRVAFQDVAVDPTLRVGAGYGSRTIFSEWLAAGFAKSAAEGTRWLTVGTVATGVVNKDPDELLDSWAGNRLRRGALPGEVRRR